MNFAQRNAEILALFVATGKEIPTEDSDMGRAVSILQTICDTQSHTIPKIDEGTSEEDAENEASEIFEAIEELAFHGIGRDDFRFEFEGNEYRLISEDEETIWPIYRDEIQEMVEDCYSDVLKLDKIPSFISIDVDWEQTARNAYDDGYGHQFSGYDGSEERAGGYYIFRTN